MILYIAVAVWPIFTYWMYADHCNRIKREPENFNFYIAITLLPMFLLLAFRNPSLGADTTMYLNNFNYVRHAPLREVLEETRMETGYIIFVKLIRHITDSSLVYQIICVTIYYIGFFTFAKRIEKKDVFWFVYFVTTLGFFFFMFTGVRQCLAISICLFSYKYCQDRKLFRFLLCMVLAYFFHKSSILFLPVYWIAGRKVSIYSVTIYGICVWVASNYLLTIQNFFNEQLEYNYGIEAAGGGTIFLFVMLLLTIFSVLMVYYKQEMDHQIVKQLVNINFITLSFWFIRLQTRVAERPSYYFLVFSCALFAHGLNLLKDRKERILLTYLIMAFSMLLFLYRLSTNNASLVPYQFY